MKKILLLMVLLASVQLGFARADNKEIQNMQNLSVQELDAMVLNFQNFKTAAYASQGAWINYRDSTRSYKIAQSLIMYNVTLEVIGIIGGLLIPGGTMFEGAMHLTAFGGPTSIYLLLALSVTVSPHNVYPVQEKVEDLFSGSGVKPEITYDSFYRSNVSSKELTPFQHLIYTWFLEQQEKIVEDEIDFENDFKTALEEFKLDYGPSTAMAFYQLILDSINVNKRRVQNNYFETENEQGFFDAYLWKDSEFKFYSTMTALFDFEMYIYDLLISLVREEIKTQSNQLLQFREKN